MTEHRLTSPQIQAFAQHLLLEEKSAATIEKYIRDVHAFACWLDGREISKELTSQWKAHLVERDYAPTSINAKLSALNSLLEFLGLNDCRVKFLRVQRRLFRDACRELTKEDYQRLLDAATRWDGNGWACWWRPSDPQASGSARYGISRWKPPGRAGRNLPQGQDPHNPAAGKALPEAAEIRPETKDHRRRDLSHQKRKRTEPPADLGGDEKSLQVRRCGAPKGVPAQSAAPVRHGVLSGLPGHRQALRPAGPQQHRDHPYLPGNLWRGASTDTGPAGAHLLITESTFRHNQ